MALKYAWQRRIFSIELLTWLALTVAVVLLVVLSKILPLIIAMPLWGGLPVVLAFRVRVSLPRLVGPLFLYDLVRTSRRSQQIVHRAFYATLLFVIIYLVFWSWFPAFAWSQPFADIRILIKDKARFAASFFNTFLFVQFALVLLVTPAYTAVAIAEEKQRRTLEFLLTTDLGDREIVLGIMASRVANLLLLVLTGLPILSFLEFMGGVDPNLILLTYLATIMTLLSLGGFSILMSVTSRTPLAALASTYAGVFLFYLFFGIVAFMPFTQAIASAGDPDQRGAGSAMLILAVLIGFYSLIHALVAIFCTISAVRQLRIMALWHAEGSPMTWGVRDYRGPRPLQRPRAVSARSHQAGAVLEEVHPPAGAGGAPTAPLDVILVDEIHSVASAKALKLAGALATRRSRPLHLADLPAHRQHPPVGDDGFLWKEIHVERVFKRIDAASINAISFSVFLFFLFALLLIFAASWEKGQDPGTFFNPVIRTLGIGVTLVMLPVIGLSSASRICKEREQNTLDSLLTLPVEPSRIWFAKWLASLLAVRRWACVLVGIWGLGVLTGGLSPFGMAFLLGAALVYCAFAATLGLWFSAASRSSLRANLFTLLAILVIAVGPGYLARWVTGTVSTGAGMTGQNWWVYVSEYGLSPPATLTAFTFRSDQLTGGKDPNHFYKILAGVVGVHGYLAAAALLWWASCYQLNKARGPAVRRSPVPQALGRNRGREAGAAIADATKI